MAPRLMYSSGHPEIAEDDTRKPQDHPSPLEICKDAIPVFLGNLGVLLQYASTSDRCYNIATGKSRALSVVCRHALS